MQINKFVIGGLLVLGAVVFLIWSSTSANSEYFLTIDELNAKSASVVDRNVRLSGAVIGDSIKYDTDSLTLTFEIAHVPGDQSLIDDQGGLAEALHLAAMDPSRARVKIEYIGPLPDLLRNEAQAIVTGQLGEDGVFHAEELLLKCPTKYEEAVPEQAAAN
jgi:cytochrome c-type biogenesis protein CcmE